MKRSSVNIAIDLRIVNVRTGRVQTGFVGCGKEETVGVSGLNELLEGVSYRNDDWLKGAIGKAARKAAQDAAKKLAAIAREPDEDSGESARVVDIVSENEFVINAGKSQCLTEKLTIEVFRTQDILNADGVKVYTKRLKLAEATVVDVQDKGSLLKVVSREKDAPAIAKGDEVRLKVAG